MTFDPTRARRWAVLAVYRARARAAQVSVPCTITPEDVLEVAGLVCPVSGTALDYEFGKGRGHHTVNSPAVDRIEPSLGYVPGNIAVLCNRLNRVKGAATPEELVALGKWAGRVIKPTEVVAIS